MLGFYPGQAYPGRAKAFTSVLVTYVTRLLTFRRGRMSRVYAKTVRQ